MLSYPPVAQLDNATDSDSGEREFKSLRAGQKKALFGVLFSMMCSAYAEREVMLRIVKCAVRV